MSLFHGRDLHSALRVIRTSEEVGTFTASRGQRLVAEQKKSQGPKRKRNVMNWSQLERESYRPASAPRLAAACGWQMPFDFPPDSGSPPAYRLRRDALGLTRGEVLLLTCEPF